MSHVDRLNAENDGVLYVSQTGVEKVARINLLRKEVEKCTTEAQCQAVLARALTTGMAKEEVQFVAENFCNRDLIKLRGRIASLPIPDHSLPNETPYQDAVYEEIKKAVGEGLLSEEDAILFAGQEQGIDFAHYNEPYLN